MAENEGFVPITQGTPEPSKKLGQKEFGELPMPHLCLKDKNTRRYLVYKDKQEFIEVEADTVKEAVQLSQIESPYKVVHYLAVVDKVMDNSLLIKEDNEEKPDRPEEKKEDNSS